MCFVHGVIEHTRYELLFFLAKSLVIENGGTGNCGQFFREASLNFHREMATFWNAARYLSAYYDFSGHECRL